MPKLPRIPYDELPLSPAVIAKACCLYRTLTQFDLDRIRRNLTRQRIDTFVEQFDMTCRRAYASNAAWFRTCVQADGDDGREALYAVATEHLIRYLRKPVEDTESD